MPFILILLVSYVMPESPRWLVAKGREKEAASVLSQIYPPHFPVEKIVMDIRETIEREKQAEHAVGWEVIFHPSPAFRRMLIVGIGTAISQQLVGIEAIQYYMVFIIKESGVQDETIQSLALILLGCLKTLFVIVAGKLFDTKGRRPLMLLSLGGEFICLLGC